MLTSPTPLWKRYSSLKNGTNACFSPSAAGVAGSRCRAADSSCVFSSIVRLLPRVMLL
jgi:hypothetical protein